MNSFYQALPEEWTEDDINRHNQCVWDVSSSSSSGDSGRDEMLRQEAEKREEQKRRRARRRRRNQQTAMVAIASYSMNVAEIPRGGSVLGRKYVYRDRMAAKRKIMYDYFADEPKYNERYFRRRFRMSKNLFIYIMKNVQQHDEYFRDKKDGIGSWGVSGLQKCLAAIRLLATGGSCDDTDHYLQIGESTASEALMRFCHAVRQIFTETYLRRPTEEDVQRITTFNEKRGFPGMLGSIDCMHWAWKNCPTGWAGRYLGHKKIPTIILEAVATHDLWFWHAFFGVPRAENDIVVLGKSDVFDEVANCKAPSCNYVVNHRAYSMGYYLADGIYPKWATLVAVVKHPRRQNERVFTARQESCRKDIERAFGVLQARWHIVARPARRHDAVHLGHIMMTCIILHNMIVENESGNIGVENWRLPSQERANLLNIEHDPNGIQLIIKRLNARAAIQNRFTNCYLVEDLIHHVYNHNATRVDEIHDVVVGDDDPSTPEPSDSEYNDDDLINDDF